MGLRPDMTAFTALALQVRTQSVNAAADPRAEMAAAVERVGAQIGGSKAWLGPELRLVVLPEHVLTGFPMGESFAEWRERAALDPDGPEYRSLAEIAARHEVFLCVNAYERDEHFPELYFQATVILSPGRGGGAAVSPAALDVHPDPVRRVGPLPGALRRGRRAAGGPHRDRQPGGARLGGGPDAGAGPRPGDSTNGGSELIDPEGRALARAGAGESLVAAAELDLDALRRARRRPGLGNLPSRVKTRLWAEEYARHDGERPGGLADGARERAWFRARQVETIRRLYG